MKKKYYDFIIDIPEFKIKKGDVCYRENGSYVMESSGKVLPSYLKMDSSVVSAHPYIREYENGMYVLPNELPSRYPGGLYIIDDFHPKDNKYVIKSVNDSSKILTLSVSKFKVADVYFFLDSKGKIQMTYTGKDTEADEWRKFNYNMFKTKDDAQRRKDEIIVGWAACLK